MASYPNNMPQTPATNPQTPPRSSNPGSRTEPWPASGKTPHTLRGSTVEFTADKDTRMAEIRMELNERIIEVDTEAFIKTFLYADREVLENDFEKDQRFGDKFCFPKGLGISGTGGFSGEEKKLQAWLTLRLEYIRTEWERQRNPPPWNEPVPQNVTIDGNSQVMAPRPGLQRDAKHKPTPLRKTFVITGDRIAKFSRATHREIGLADDISLWVRKTDLGKDDPTADLLSDGAPRATEQPFWKDLAFIIEVKTEALTIAHIVQVATYLQAMKFDQYDRNFFFLATMTDDEFRIWRWDNGCCYVSEPIFYRVPPGQPLPYSSSAGSQPEGAGLSQLVRIIGRITSMSPTELGFDPSFENAGRNLGTILEVKRVVPVLTIKPSDGGPACRYLIRRPIFERYDSIFSRCTRVWRVRPVKDGTAAENNAVVIKQGWEDDSRPSEAKIYERIQKIKTVEKLPEGCSNGLVAAGPYQLAGEDDGGSSWRTFAWPQSDAEISNAAIKGYYKIEFLDAFPRPDVWKCRFVPTSRIPQIVHRSLARFAFDEEYLPLSECRSPLEMLYVLKDVVLGIKTLHENGILHRDISTGNVMLRKKRWNGGPPPNPGSVAVLIDYSIALVDTPDGEGDGSAGTGAHAHISGTLPFMALDVLRKALNSEYELHRHLLQHDLESVFWLAIYYFTDNSRCATDKDTKNAMRGIRAMNPERVKDKKVNLVIEPKQGLRGKGFWLGPPCTFLEDFFRAFARFSQNPEDDFTFDNLFGELDNAIEASGGQVVEFPVPRKTGEKRPQDCPDTEPESSKRLKKTGILAPKAKPRN